MTTTLTPPASDTNSNGDFSRNQFLAGRMALFQSGTYNLAAIAEDSRFRWGVVPMPIGPVGRVSVTNGIAAAGNSATAFESTEITAFGRRSFRRHDVTALRSTCREKGQGDFRRPGAANQR